MAQIIVTATPVNLNVSTTQSNITVTDVETNVTVNVASLSSNVTVSSTPVNVVLAPSIGVSNSEIRAALSVTAPLTYDSVNGVFGFDPSANNMQVASLTATNYIQTSGNVTAAGLTTTNNATIGGTLDVGNGITNIGNYYQTGANVLFAQGNIINGSLQLNNNITIGGNFNGNLKDISLSYYDAGNVSGNVTLDVSNGPVQKIRLTNNLTGLSFTGATAAQPITVIIQQDSVGFWTLDTTTHAGNWTNWLFTSNYKTLSTSANAYDYLSITYDGVKYYASLVNFVQTLITNSELANSNVIVNGTTINLGSSGNISHFGSLTTTALPEGTNLYFTAARARGNISAVAPITYNSGTGQIGFADLAQIGGLTVNGTGAYPGVSLIATKYLTSNVAHFIGNVWVTEKITATGNVQGNYILGNGAFLTGVTSLTNAQVLSYIATQPLTVGGNLTVNGNINATGNINVQNVEDLYVRDRTIVLNANAASAANVQIVANRPSLTNVELKWNETTDRWTFTNNGTIYFNMPESTTDLAEGANLYYTTARANTAIGAYQGNINTPGTITAGVSNATTVNATTVNVTDLTTTGNATVLGKLNAADGSNVQYVRAYSTELYIENTSASLPILMFGESNNRISTGDQSLRYVPATKTLFVSEGTIGTNTNNVAGNNFTISGTTTSFGNITTNATVQAGFFKGNGSQLTGIPANIAGSENITVTGNVVSLKNALANVNSVTSELGQDVTLTGEKTLLRSRVRNNASVNAANIDGLGFAIYDSTTSFFADPNLPYITYSGTNELKALIFDGTCTTGSNVITVTNVYDATGNTLGTSNIFQYYGFSEYPGAYQESISFPPGTYVTSVSGSNVYMSANALTNTTFTADLSVTGYSIGSFFPQAYDTVTGLGLGFITAFDNAFFGDPPGSATTIGVVQTNNLNPVYGYPASGPVKADFVFPYDTANFTVASFANVMLAKTDISASRTVPAFNRGLTVGSADLTNRGVGDRGTPTFGVNILWDGTANVTQEYSSSGGISPQILLRSFSDGTVQGINGNTATTWSSGGPRLLFMNGFGKATDSLLTTYARTNQELGKIGWTSTTSSTVNPSSFGPAAYISAVSLKDQTTGPGDVGLYLVASPTTSATSTGQIGGSAARLLWAGHHKSNTIISAGSRTNGTAGNVIFAPGRQSSNQSNGALMSELIVNSANGSPHWATIGYDVPTSNTGARIAITNGNNTTSARNGNLSLAINRKDNGVGFGSKEWAFKLRSGQNDLVLTEDNIVRTTFAGGNITASYFIGDGSALTNVSATGFTNFAVTGQSTVVADTAGDTMTLVAGSGMVITTDAATDTITFTSTGGYGNAEVANFLANGYGSNTISTTGNITAGNTIVNGVSFNTAGTTSPSSGQIVYNSNYGTHQVGLNGSNVMLMGQDLVVYANNGEANTLLKGEVVYVSGATGNKATIKRAVNSSDLNSATTIGIVKSDIAAGALGYVVSQGVVDGLNLGAYTAGDKLYLGNVAGTFTNIKPQAPEHYVFIGVVERANAGNGQVLVRVQNGFELDEIHDIKLTGVQQNDVLVRNSGNTLWVNQNFGTTLTNTPITLKQFAETKVDLGTTNGNITLNMANGSIFTMTANGNISNIALANASIGSSGTLIITQDNVGSRLMTVTSAWKFAGASKTLTTTANAIDIVNFFTDGTTVYAALSKGYA